MSDNPQQQQQQAWHNYYAYQQQYYAQQPPAYPFAAPPYQSWNPINAAGTPQPMTPPMEQAYSAPALPPPKRPRTEVTDHSYHCDVCELTLESQISLAAHLKSHTVCTDCTFTASPKLVKAHHAAVHGKFRGNGFKTISVAIPGCKVQRYRICVGNHPDDIKKWIADRRKKFPRQQPLHKPAAAKDESHLSGLLDGYGSSSEDDEVQPAKAESKVDANPQIAESKVDTRLLVSNVDEPKIATAICNSANYRSQTCRYFARTGTCRNGDECTFRHERANQNASNSVSLQSQPQREQNRRNIGNHNKKTNSKTTGTTSLLRSLLQSDAKRETTLTLQLLQYIVDCNFLQKAQPEQL
jgi:hypothetical protein